MADFNYSTPSDGQTVTFDPAIDTFNSLVKIESGLNIGRGLDSPESSARPRVVSSKNSATSNSYSHIIFLQIRNRVGSGPWTNRIRSQS